MKTGFCPKCGRVRKITRHHIYPRRIFGRGKNNIILLLCVECHRDIERIIPRKTQLTKEQYRQLTVAWLRNKPPTIFLP